VTYKSTRASMLLKSVSEKATSALGEAAGRALAEKLWEVGGRWWVENEEADPPCLTPPQAPAL
jgi:hypothetical protein